LGERVFDQSVDFAESIESRAEKSGFDYVSIGPALPSVEESYAVIPDILKKTRSVFLAGVIASRQDGVSLRSIHACSGAMQKSSVILPNGFANLRFAALANVLPGAPFFPAAYSGDRSPSFALATEAADLAVDAVKNAETLQEAKERLVELVESHAHKMSAISEKLESDVGVVFGGIDFSLAPFPVESTSIGKALERIGIDKIGLHGSLAAAAFLTSALESARFPRAGFSGLFLPVLEDSILAERAAEGLIGTTELLLYSAVCGTGLDTLPLPGDVTIKQLSAILLDLAALALRLDKPLTARLMPVPGKKSGDLTDFDFPYFANSRILPVKGVGISGLFTGTESFQLAKRSSA
jgi:uncharacterized protein (UPF0210 family)